MNKTADEIQRILEEIVKIDQADPIVIFLKKAKACCEAHKDFTVR